MIQLHTHLELNITQRLLPHFHEEHFHEVETIKALESDRFQFVAKEYHLDIGWMCFFLMH